MQSAIPLFRSLAEIGVVIPAWRPGGELLKLIEQIRCKGFGAIVVIDDGSGTSFSPVFSEIEDKYGLKVLRHAVNLGKGRALKTGFNWILTEHSSLNGIVTADADGQHAICDILRVADTLCAEAERVVLGVRSFERNVPLRSRLGNILTRNVFRLATGSRISDTQTGLRGIPQSRLGELMVLEGEHYEFELTMLAHLCRLGQDPVQVPVSTIYIDGNRSSHFNPIRDSMRIYFVFMRLFSFSQQRAFALKRSGRF